MSTKAVIIRKRPVIPTLDLTSPDNNLLRGFCYFMCMRTAEAQNYKRILTTTGEFKGEFSFLSEDENKIPMYTHIVVDQSRTYDTSSLNVPVPDHTQIVDPDDLGIIDDIRESNPEKSDERSNMIDVLIGRMINLIGFEDDRPDKVAVDLVMMCICDDIRTVVTQHNIVTVAPDWKAMDRSIERADMIEDLIGAFAEVCDEKGGGNDADND